MRSAAVQLTDFWPGPLEQSALFPDERQRTGAMRCAGRLVVSTGQSKRSSGDHASVGEGPFNRTLESIQINARDRVTVDQTASIRFCHCESHRLTMGLVQVAGGDRLQCRGNRELATLKSNRVVGGTEDAESSGGAIVADGADGDGRGAKARNVADSDSSVAIDEAGDGVGEGRNGNRNP